MNISVAIQHHPSRADLAAVLAAEVPGAVLVADPDPDCGVPSPWRTYRRALEETPAEATHRLVLQDDAIVCPGFLPAAHAAIAARPNRMIAFYVGGNARPVASDVRAAARRRAPWVELRNMTWCPAVALAWPAPLIGECLAFVDAQVSWPLSFTMRGCDDEIIGRFLGHAGVTAIATVPSLVDHPDDVPSLIRKRHRGGRDPGRVAACWIGDCDPASIDWTA